MELFDSSLPESPVRTRSAGYEIGRFRDGRVSGDKSISVSARGVDKSTRPNHTGGHRMFWGIKFSREITSNTTVTGNHRGKARNQRAQFYSFRY